ncbi:MAG: hypothetical protein JOZ69_16395 [Myxococcales bacterium]|nr:hypothetical protein [Myxococcales bacterium]
MESFRSIVASISALSIAVVVSACGSNTGGSSESAGTGPEGTASLDELLAVGDAGGVVAMADGGRRLGGCGQCVQNSCARELGALESDLRAERAALVCVRDDACLQNFWVDARDAGRADALKAVADCVAACDKEAGAPGLDAATSTFTMLTTALNTCAVSSCASSCPAIRPEAAADAGSLARPDAARDRDAKAAADAPDRSPDAASDDRDTRAPDGGDRIPRIIPVLDAGRR